MATQLNRKRRSPSNKLTELLWEPDDAYTLTPLDISRGWFEHQLIHPRINYKLLVRCKVNAGEYAHTDMVVDETTGIVHVTLGGWETVDEYVRFQYYYRHGGRLVPAPDPVPTEYIVPQAIHTSPTSMFEGMAFSDATGPHPGYTGSPAGKIEWAFSWTLPADYPTFAELGIYGIKIRGTFTGDGIYGLEWGLDDPAYGAPGGWPDAGDGAGSFIYLDSYYGGGGGGNIVVVPADGVKTWEHEFPVNDTASDPYFEGWNYKNLLEKLEMSLRTNVANGDSYDHVYGQLNAQGPDYMDTMILSFDLILMGMSTP